MILRCIASGQFLKKFVRKSHSTPRACSAEGSRWLSKEHLTCYCSLGGPPARFSKITQPLFLCCSQQYQGVLLPLQQQPVTAQQQQHQLQITCWHHSTAPLFLLQAIRMAAVLVAASSACVQQL
jgi:hypothetical protein